MGEQGHSVAAGSAQCGGSATTAIGGGQRGFHLPLRTAVVEELRVELQHGRLAVANAQHGRRR